MTTKSDPLSVLLEIKATMDSRIDDELVICCYQLQSEHQYDKERETMKKMRALIEDAIVGDEGGNLL